MFSSSVNHGDDGTSCCVADGTVEWSGEMLREDSIEALGRVNDMPLPTMASAAARESETDLAVIVAIK